MTAVQEALGGAILDLAPDALSSPILRKVFGRFPSGVAAVCGEVDQKPIGMAVSSFTSVSLEPPLVSICIAQTSKSWSLLRQARNLGVSILSAEHGFACRQLSAKSGDRFEGVSLRRSRSGALFIANAAAWLDCGIEREIDAGDHYIVLLAINSLGLDPDISPLVFHDSDFCKIAKCSA
jgi:flavin reductase (DIM6/NTAB) family NADH-FMN oxidoreductase RutF